MIEFSPVCIIRHFFLTLLGDELGKFYCTLNWTSFYFSTGFHFNTSLISSLSSIDSGLKMNGFWIQPCERENPPLAESRAYPWKDGLTPANGLFLFQWQMVAVSFHLKFIKLWQISMFVRPTMTNLEWKFINEGRHRCRSRQVLGSAKDFCLNFHKLARQIFLLLFVRIFFHENRISDGLQN